MGLLDSILSGVAAQSGGAQQTGGGLGGAGLGPLAEVLGGLLANNGAQGGLGGLVEKFNQAGLGDVIASWIGHGQNLPISGAQLQEILGSDFVAQIAAQLGLNQGQASNQLSDMLPGLVDQLTPQGAAPESGLGDAGDLFGMLGGLLDKK